MAKGRFQEMVDSNFQLYKRVTEDEAFQWYFFDWLFERYRSMVLEEETA